MGTRCNGGLSIGVAVLAGWLLWSSTAAAQARERWSLVAGLGAGSLVSRDQLGYLRYLGIGAGVALTGSYRLLGPFSADARLAIAGFVSERPTGSLVELGLGPRLLLQVPGTDVEIAPAAHVHVAQTGADTRPSLALSVRALFPIGQEWALGPEVLAERVFQTAQAVQVSTDADFWLLSVVLAYRPRVPAEPPKLVERPPPKPRKLIVLAKAPPLEVPPAPPSPELSLLLDEVVTRRVETRLLAPVLFEFDSTQLTTCGEAALLYARDVLGQFGDRVIVEGHADGTGTDDYNQTLSEQRAEFVRQWMVEHGVPAERLQVQARGEHQLLVEESNVERTQLNRRVTFRVIEEETP